MWEQTSVSIVLCLQKSHTHVNASCDRPDASCFSVSETLLVYSATFGNFSSLPFRPELCRATAGCLHGNSCRMCPAVRAREFWLLRIPWAPRLCVGVEENGPQMLWLLTSTPSPPSRLSPLSPYSFYNSLSFQPPLLKELCLQAVAPMPSPSRFSGFCSTQEEERKGQS